LYQQRPTPAEGDIFKRAWFKYYKVLPSKFDEVIMSWDCAFKDNKENDFVVGQVWGRVGADKYLIDQVRDRMDFPTTVSAFRNMSYRYPECRVKLIEDKANGSAVISTLKHEISGIVPVNPEGGKISRASAVTGDFEAGNVYLPDPSLKRWVLDYVEELVSFPNGAHDDCVDSTSQALNRLINRGVLKAVNSFSFGR
jgi:predicted phage terminase large subunit-like protein